MKLLAGLGFVMLFGGGCALGVGAPEWLWVVLVGCGAFIAVVAIENFDRERAEALGGIIVSDELSFWVELSDVPLEPPLCDMCPDVSPSEATRQVVVSVCFGSMGTGSKLLLCEPCAADAAAACYPYREGNNEPLRLEYEARQR